MCIRDSVEGDQCRTGGLCAHHTFDGGVDAGDAGLFAGDEAAGRLGVCIGGVKGGLPCGDVYKRQAYSDNKAVFLISIHALREEGDLHVWS